MAVFWIKDSMKTKAFILALCASLSACGDGEPAEFSFTSEGIKTLSHAIRHVDLTDQVSAPGTKFVQIDLKQDPVSGGAQDWNLAASDFHRLAKRLFQIPNTARLSVSFETADGKSWARIFLKRDQISQNWQGMTYLEFFSQADPRAATLEFSSSLCEFWHQYESARPASGLPASCKD